MINIPFEKIYSGKVRDIYEIDNDKLLMIASDRISAFDFILPEQIPFKGEILTNISKFWFNFLRDIVPNHLTKESLFYFLPSNVAQVLANRSIIVKKLTPIKCESIVRGYITGSAWKEYKEKRSVNGIKIDQKLQEYQKLNEVLFTPSTKAEVGSNDEYIDFDYLVNLIGKDLALKIKDISIRLYHKAFDYAYDRGIIIADTKFEFGIDKQGNLLLMDEILTPDSSRFWSKSEYKIGINPPSYDKQFIRDYLEKINWNKKPPVPHIPDNIIKETMNKYHEVEKLIIS